MTKQQETAPIGGQQSPTRKKPEWPSLLIEGIHCLPLNELADLTKDLSAHRNNLWSGFAALYDEFIKAGLSGVELWVDGSYLTSKPEPSDIDCVLWLPQQHVDACTDTQYARLVYFRDRSAIKRRYCIDLHLVPPEEQINIAYWTTWFGTKYDGVTPKGFVSLTL